MKKHLYISPLYFDLINIVSVNFVFFIFFKEVTSGPLLLRALIGTPIVLSSFYFEVITHRVLAKAHSHPNEIRKLVTEGVYAKLRHPIYFGRILLNIGFLIIFPIIPMLIIAIGFIFTWYLMANYEERILIKKFGKKYLSYKKKVPMFIPKAK
jgi:protein-S-isoprenylcysteine O-methyltransferase Ste14